MKLMNIPSFTPNGVVTPEQIMPLATKIIIGSTVCITEGVVASIAFGLPNDVWLYLGYLVLAISIWVVMGRYRNTKLGADICDLYFYEIIVWSLATGFYIMEKNTEIFWYLTVGLLFLKLTRVYAWQGTTTNELGWGVLGFCGYFYNKKHKVPKLPNQQGKKALALFMAIGLAAIGTVLSEKLTAQQREAVPWAFAIIYVTLNGPILLRSLGAFIQKFLASTTREAADAVEKAKMRQTIEALQTTHNLADERAALLLAAFFNTHERKRDHMLEMAQLLAAHYPANPKPPA